MMQPLRIPNRLHEAVVRQERERVGLPINMPPPAWPWMKEKRAPAAALEKLGARG